MYNLSATFVLVTILAALAPVKTAPTMFMARHAGHDETTTSAASDIVKQNALDAQKLNAQYATANATDSCKTGEMSCIEGGFAQCISGKWLVSDCPNNLRCYALPLVNTRGTSLVCDTEQDSLARFTAAGVSGGRTGSENSTATTTTATITTTTTTGGVEAEGGEGDGEDCPEGEDPISEEDLPECDDSEAFPESTTPSSSTVANQAIATSSSAAASSADYQHNYRRQASTIATLPALSTAPAATVVAPASSTTSDAVVTPTVAIGSNVTVVSTVTVSATDCAATTASSIIPVVTVAPTFAPITVSSARIPPASSAAASSSSVPVQNKVTSAAVTVVTAAPVSSTPATVIRLTVQPSASPSGVVNRPGGITFSFGTTTAALAARTALLP